jgi:hypothetical protein
MRKKLLVCGIALFFIFTLSSGVFAQLGGLYGLDSMMMSDWQLDYLKPIDPDDLEKGEFRLTPIISRLNNNYERNYYNDTEDNSYDNSTMAYILVFDTKFTEKLSLHSKLMYNPWDERDNYLSDNKYESRSTLTDIFLNYEFKEDKTIFFGYNRILEKDKRYNNDILNYEDEDAVNTYYLGFEIRGSFAGDNK